MLVAFVLNMPQNNSWNGKWSGDGQCYARVKNVGTAKKSIAKYEEIIKNGPYRYDFGDGWVAQVKVQEVNAKEAAKLRKNSKGFCGYDWMIDSIIFYGEIRY